jgi:hypothetical protein
MNARFRPPSAGQVQGAAGLFDAAAQRRPTASPSGEACSCVARAAVRVFMPPTAARPHETELLLCGHHYRVSRAALATAHATVSELPGSADDPDAWFHGDSGTAIIVGDQSPVPAAPFVPSDRIGSVRH